MNRKLFWLSLLLIASAVMSAGLLGVPRARFLKIVDKVADLESNADDLRRMLPPKPIQMDDLSRIVKRVAESTGLSIESQDSGLDIIDFHLTRKAGRSLNLIINKESDELMHFSVSSDKEEVLGESQFSAFGANEHDIQEILQTTIQSADLAQNDRKLVSLEKYEFDNFEADVLGPSGIKDSWEVTSDPETRQYFLTLKDSPTSQRVKVKFTEKDGKKGLVLDDRAATGGPFADHLYVYIGLSHPQDNEVLINSLKSRMEMYKARHQTAAKPQASSAAILDFAKELVTAFDAKDLVSSGGKHMLSLSLKSAPNSIVGAVSLDQLKPGLSQLKFVVYSRVLTVFIHHSQFDSQKQSIEGEFKNAFRGLLGSTLDMERIVRQIGRKMSAVCGKAAQLTFDKKSDTVFTFFSTRKDDDKACIFLRSDMILTFHHFELFGKLDYVHIFVSNPVLQTELTYQADAQKLEQSVSGFVLDLFSEMNDALAFYENPGQYEATDKAKAEEVLKSKGFIDAGEGKFELQNENGKVTITLGDSEEYLSVAVETRKTTLVPGESFNTSKELWIPKGSTSDEKARLTAVVDNAVQDLQK